MRKPNFFEERKLWKQNFKYVIGVDETGRGAFAGPIIAAAVVFPVIKRITKKHYFLRQVNDSKKLKAKVRRKLAKKILKHALFHSIGEIDIKTINRVGIGRANYMVFRKVIRDLLSQIRNIKKEEHFLLCDGFPVRYIRNVGLKGQTGIIDGDEKSVTIAAASIIAKVHRDKLMRELSKEYSNYKFSRNKGYGTRAHQEALRIYGLSKIHRTSFDLNKFLTETL